MHTTLWQNMVCVFAKGQTPHLDFPEEGFYTETQRIRTFGQAKSSGEECAKREEVACVTTGR